MNDEMLNDRTEAQRFPCRYRLPRPRVRRRDDEDDSKWLCGAGVGEPCRDPRTHRPIEHLAAHLVRLQDAGRAPTATHDKSPSGK